MEFPAPAGGSDIMALIYERAQERYRRSDISERKQHQNRTPVKLWKGKKCLKLTNS
ncbi:MAG: hypothetical protein K1W36_07570 [Lachnospiraceae bacterium]